MTPRNAKPTAETVGLANSLGRLSRANDNTSTSVSGPPRLDTSLQARLRALRDAESRLDGEDRAIVAAALRRLERAA